jgi:hypothetical protein
MPFEIITTTDKAKRDQMFQDLRQNGNELERQVVKFSSNEPDDDLFINTSTGRRLIYRSTWSVAYPTS